MKLFPATFLSVLMMSVAAQAAEPVTARAIDPYRYRQFENEVAAFARTAVTAGQGASTLFVGSSSIRLWDVAASFPGHRVINRGFGGATTADVLHYYRQVIANTAPSTVIVYVGENDIAEGVPPAHVAGDVLTLLAQLRRDLPQARIAWLSLKPTPARWDLYPRMAEVNAEIAARARTGGGFDYLDVGSLLMGAEGRPEADYFGADHLHMSARGYARWTRLIDAYLMGEPARPRLSQPPQGAS